MLQLMIGSPQRLPLRPQQPHDPYNDIPDEQKGYKTNERQAVICEFVESEIGTCVRYQPCVQKGNEQAVAKDRFKLILPAHEQQWDTEEQQILPGALFAGYISMRRQEQVVR